MRIKKNNIKVTKLKILSLFISYIFFINSMIQGQNFLQVPNRLIGDINFQSQFSIQLIYMISGLIDSLNFSWFMWYQFNNCEALYMEFSMFLKNIFSSQKSRETSTEALELQFINASHGIYIGKKGQFSY